MQLWFEDSPGGGDLEYLDDIYNVTGVMRSIPASLMTTVAADQGEVQPVEMTATRSSSTTLLPVRRS